MIGCCCRIGEEVPFAKRGRYGVVHGSVEQHFRPYHIMVETGNLDDLTEAELVLKVCLWLLIPKPCLKPD